MKKPVHQSLKDIQKRVTTSRVVETIARTSHPKALVRLALQNYALRRGLPADALETYLQETTNYAVARASVFRARFDNTRIGSRRKAKNKQLS